MQWQPPTLDNDKNYEDAVDSDDDDNDDDDDDTNDVRVMIEGQPRTNPPTALIVTLAHHHLTPLHHTITPCTIHLLTPILYRCSSIHLTP